MRNSRARRGRFLSMSFISVGLAFCGFAVVLCLLYQNDYRAVLRTVADAGAGVAVVVLVRGVILAACGLAWWCLLRNLAAVRLRVVLGLRTVGEAVNVLLPVAAVGGDVVRARLLNLGGVAGGVAAASALVDLLLQAAAQGLFALIGVALLMQVAVSTEIVPWAVRGLGIAALALGGFYAAQRFGGARLVEWGLGALARRRPATAFGSAIRLHDLLQVIYAGRSAIAVAFSLHGLAWLFGAFETWIALWLMGVPASAPEALILESLSGASRGGFPDAQWVGHPGGRVYRSRYLIRDSARGGARSVFCQAGARPGHRPAQPRMVLAGNEAIAANHCCCPPPAPHGHQAALWANGPLTNGSAFTPQADDQNE